MPIIAGECRFLKEVRIPISRSSTHNIRFILLKKHYITITLPYGPISSSIPVYINDFFHYFIQFFLFFWFLLLHIPESDCKYGACSG